MSLSKKAQRLVEIALGNKSSDAASVKEIVTQLGLAGQDAAWTKVSYSYSDFSAAAMSKTLALLTLQPKQYIDFLMVINVAFSGGGATNTFVVAPFVGQQDLTVLPGDPNIPVGSGNSLNAINMAVSTPLSFEVTSDVNLNQLTAGQFDFWYRVHTVAEG